MTSVWNGSVGLEGRGPLSQLLGAQTFNSSHLRPFQATQEEINDPLCHLHEHTRHVIQIYIWQCIDFTSCISSIKLKL